MNRLDELLKRLDTYAPWDDDAAYLAAVLRAGRELRDVVGRYQEWPARHEWLMLAGSVDNYDNAINGDGQAVPGGNDAEG